MHKRLVALGLTVILAGCASQTASVEPTSSTATPSPGAVATPVPTPAPTPPVEELTPQPVPEETLLPSEEPTATPMPVGGDANIELVKASMVRWINAIDDAKVQIIVQVRNTGSGWADLGSPGDYTIYDKSDGVTVTGDFPSGYPHYLGPGATGYLLAEDGEDGGSTKDFARIEVNLDWAPADGPGPKVTLGRSQVKTGYFGDGVDVSGTIKNESEATLDLWVAAILFDANKNPIGFNDASVDGLKPGRTKGWVADGGRDLKRSLVKSILTLPDVGE